MDSEDEAFQEELDQHARNKDWRAARAAVDFGDCISLKLYQKEERKALNIMCRARHGEDNPVGLLDWTRDWSAIYRFERFVDSVVGYHKGCLDLTGRHEYRWLSLTKRWTRFATDVLKVFRHTKRVERPKTDVHGEPCVDQDGKPILVKDLAVDPAEVLEGFQRDWRTGPVNIAYIFKHTMEAIEFLSEHLTPIFQKLLLQDLPPEIIHEIMHAAGPNLARRLGSTSKYFREVALSYVYLDRFFDMPFHLEGTALSKPLEEMQQYIGTQARNGCLALMEEMDFVLSRPDILRSIRHLGFFGSSYGHAKDMLDLEFGSQEYTDIFGPIESRVGPILEGTPNVEIINFTNLFISTDMLQSLAASHNLRKLFISSVQMTRTHIPLQLSSVTNITIYFSFPEASSLWALLKSCPSLRFLNLIFSDEADNIEPPNEIRARSNPFGSLERLILKQFGFLDIEFLTQWMREAMSLRLRRFWLQGGQDGIFQVQTAQILGALGPAPLQVLVLDGLHHAEPSLLREIAALFPDLRGLTLFYRDSFRQTQTRSVLWPHASWEYAPYLHNFHRLEFFCWNFEVNIMEMAFHRTLKSFEEGFPEFSWKIEAEESLADWNSVARVLAAYCPTLKYVSFHICPECVISRTPSGSIIVTGGDMEAGGKWGRTGSTKEYLPHFPSDWEFM